MIIYRLLKSNKILLVCILSETYNIDFVKKGLIKRAKVRDNFN